MKNSSLLRVITLLPFLAIIAGCATVIRGTTDTLVINSTPSGANVSIHRINSKKEPIIGSTPGSFKLARKGEYRVEVSKQDYKTVEAIIGNKYVGLASYGILGRAIASGGIFGVLIDTQTGASKNLSPDLLEVTLEPGAGKVLFEDIPEQVSEVSN